MAVTAHAKLDVQRIRADFPFLEQSSERQAARLSSTRPRRRRSRARCSTRCASSTRPRTRTSTAASTGSPSARPRATRARARRCARSSTRRRRARSIFTRSATEAINLVAYAWGLDNLGPGDVVVVTELEHHSNFVPWQYIAKRTGAELPARSRSTTRASCGSTRSTSSPRDGNVKVVATNLVSNSLGTINPVEQLAAWAHEQGAIMVVDAAQAAPHRPIDVQALGCDFLAFSVAQALRPERRRRALGPARAARADGAVQPRRRDDPLGRARARRRWNELPYKFEAGTPPIAEAVGFGAAIDYLSEIGLDAIERHEHELTAYALERLARARLGHASYGPPAERRAGIVSFDVDGIHPHDVAQILDWEGVAIRAGHHCSQPLMARLGVAATTRASFYLYTIPEEIDRLVDGLHKVKKVLG